MMSLPRFFQRLWFALVIGILLTGCEQIANPYSAEAYKQATSLKAKSLALIKNGTQPYSANASKAETLLVEISAAHEFARGRGRKNSDEAADQWAIILDPEGNSVGEFVALWREKGKLNPFFVNEFSSIVSLQFDRIIELETGRKITAE
ncbi:MAG: hypothetical protein AB3N12_13480 [Ruegeria sp.]